MEQNNLQMYIINRLNTNTLALEEFFESSLSLQIPRDTRITSSSLHVLLISFAWTGRRVGVLLQQNKNKQEQY